MSGTGAAPPDSRSDSNDEGTFSSHTSDSRKAIAFREAKISTAANFILFVIKIVLAMYISSIALTADAFHTLSDISTSLVVFISFRAASHAPDREHPFGHGRWEPIATLIIAVMLLTAGFQIFIGGVGALYSGSHGEANVAVAVVILFTAAGKELLARYAFSLGKEIDSSTLNADAWHHRTDALSSAGVAVAILLSDTVPFIDGAAAILVSLLIMWTGFRFIRETADVLLGTAPDGKLVGTIRDIAIGRDEVSDVHKIVVHDYLTTRCISFHVVMDDSLSLHDAHDIADGIEHDVAQRLTAQVTVHLDPESAAEEPELVAE